jgi:hypothetical protein
MCAWGRFSASIWQGKMGTISNAQDLSEMLEVFIALQTARVRRPTFEPVVGRRRLGRQTFGRQKVGGNGTGLGPVGHREVHAGSAGTCFLGWSASSHEFQKGAVSMLPYRHAGTRAAPACSRGSAGRSVLGGAPDAQKGCVLSGCFSKFLSLAGRQRCRDLEHSERGCLFLKTRHGYHISRRADEARVGTYNGAQHVPLLGRN